MGGTFRETDTRIGYRTCGSRWQETRQFESGIVELYRRMQWRMVEIDRWIQFEDC
jgi:hypothetical protein